MQVRKQREGQEHEHGLAAGGAGGRFGRHQEIAANDTKVHKQEERQDDDHQSAADRLAKLLDDDRVQADRPRAMSR